MSHHFICLLIFLFVFGSFLSACSSKIPYGSTYYFPLEPKATAAKKTVEPEQLKVSIDRLMPLKPSVATQIEEASIKISRWVPPATKEVIINPQATYAGLSKKEQKKAVKTQVKALKSEIKQAKKQQKQEQQRPTKNLRNGIILGAAGLIMMIIFGAAGIGILVGIGAIVLVVGIVLILLDLLEV